MVRDASGGMALKVSGSERAIKRGQVRHIAFGFSVVKHGNPIGTIYQGVMIEIETAGGMVSTVVGAEYSKAPISNAPPISLEVPILSVEKIALRSSPALIARLLGF